MQTQEIPLQALNQAADPMSAPPGTLARCHNAVRSGSGLRPLLAPKTLRPLYAENDGPTRMLAVHSVTLDGVKTRFVISAVRSEHNDETQLYAHRVDNSDAGRLLMALHDEILSVSILGNTLVVNTAVGLRYLLWKDNAYTDLGARPDLPAIEFALAASQPYCEEIEVNCKTMAKVTDAARNFFGLNYSVETDDDKWAETKKGLTEKASTQTQWNIDPPTYPDKDGLDDPAVSALPGDDTAGLIAYVSNTIIGMANKYCRTASETGRFTQPFFVRYALRMFDDSLICHSAPVLMLPTDSPPRIEAKSGTNFQKIKARLSATPATLVYRLLENDLRTLENWKDLIKSVDVFVSAPLWTYDQSREVGTTFCNPFMPETNRMETFRAPSSSRVEDVKSWLSDPTTAPTLTESPLYAETEGGTGVRFDQTDGPLDSGYYWNVPRRPLEDLYKEMEQTSLFYLVESIPVEDLVKIERSTSYTTGGRRSHRFSVLHITPGSLTALQARPQMTDDYQSRHTLLPQFTTVYNGRLNMANVSILPPSPLPIRSSASCRAKGMNALQGVNVFVRVRKNGVTSWVAAWNLDPRHDQGYASALDAILSEDRHLAVTPAGQTAIPNPYWLYYPDVDADRLAILFYDDHRAKSAIYLKLSPHPTLNGAYWRASDWKALAASPTLKAGSLTEFINDLDSGDNYYLTMAPETPVPYENKLYASEINNPFYFPLSGITTIGTGRILGIRSATMPLSQGQFGSFPLYAFCTDGIWALAPSASGYSATQPVALDVCLNSDSIAQSPNAVFFVSVRGVCMLTGSQVTLLSGAIDSEQPEDTAAPPLSEFLRNCRLFYDFRNHRLYAYRPLSVDPQQTPGQTSAGAALFVKAPSFSAGDQSSPSFSAGDLILPADPDLNYVLSPADAAMNLRPEFLQYILDLDSGTWSTASLPIFDHVPDAADTLVSLGRTSADDPYLALASVAEGSVPAGTLSLVSRPLALIPDVLKTLRSAALRGVVDWRSSGLVWTIEATRDWFNWAPVIAPRGSNIIETMSGTPWRAFRFKLSIRLRRYDTLSSLSLLFEPRFTNKLR